MDSDIILVQNVEVLVLIYVYVCKMEPVDFEKEKTFSVCIIQYVYSVYNYSIILIPLLIPYYYYR